ncbi:MAG: hypothetical protein Q4C47_01405 [Planctomycetia bacterium]|nr:hypothetical protein [Planctomycetia bacterium]
MARQDIQSLLKLRRSERNTCRAALSEMVSRCAALAEQKRAVQMELRSLDELPSDADAQSLADRDARRQYLSRELRLYGRKLILAQEQERLARENFMESQKQVRAIEEFLEKRKTATQWELRRREERN